MILKSHKPNAYRTLDEVPGRDVDTVLERGLVAELFDGAFDAELG